MLNISASCRSASELTKTAGFGLANFEFDLALSVFAAFACFTFLKFSQSSSTSKGIEKKMYRFSKNISKFNCLNEWSIQFTMLKYSLLDFHFVGFSKTNFNISRIRLYACVFEDV